MSLKKVNGEIHIVGAGLAGSECALQLAEMGHQVFLYEMRPVTMTPAHKTGLCAELVCSNSLGSVIEPTAPSQLKWEMSQLNSFILKAAHENHVPAGQALSVDRDLFAKAVTDLIDNHPRIKKIPKVIESLDEIPRPAVIATGPLTHEKLSQSMRDHFNGDFLYFYDAIAPIIDADSINMDICFKASRYDKGGADYINCPLNKEQYFALIEAIGQAEVVKPKDFESTPYFESCLPVEVIVSRGPLTLSFGPCKPRGLKDPRTGREPYAVVQLRQENKYATAYNMVGFQTKMTYPEQKRVFRMIPGLEKAEFLKLGSLHRNLFIHSPKLLTKTLNSKKDPLLFFAGQITGVEGYFESTCTGMLVAHFLNAFLNDKPAPIPPADTALGALLNAITEEKEAFQPTNINWGLFPPLPPTKKADKKAAHVLRAKQAFSGFTFLAVLFFSTLGLTQSLNRLDYQNPTASLGACGGTIHLSFSNDYAKVQQTGSSCETMSVGREIRKTDNWTLPLNTEVTVKFRSTLKNTKATGSVFVSTLAPGAALNSSATPVPTDSPTNGLDEPVPVQPSGTANPGPSAYQSTKVPL